MNQNFLVGHLESSIRIVYSTIAQHHVGSGQYQSKEIRIETMFSGTGRRNKVLFTVTGREDGKPFRYEFKQYDLAVDKYNGMNHTVCGVPF